MYVTSSSTEIPFSVNVPVLSKTIVETHPETLILDILRQLILCLFNLFNEKLTPMLMTIGISGGIGKVSASKILMMICSKLKYSIMIGNIDKIVVNQRTNKDSAYVFISL